MAYYKDKYLHSEEWKSLRKLRIFRDGFRCKLCGKRPKRHREGAKGKRFGKGLQVHHLDYKHLHDVEASDLRTLCAECHAQVHKLMDKYPKMKKLPRGLQWETVVYHLRPDLRASLAGKIKGINERGKPCKQGRTEGSNTVTTVGEFAKLKNILFSSGVICRQRMKWRDSFNSCTEIIKSMTSPESLLETYIKVTGQDPRRSIPVVWSDWQSHPPYNIVGKRRGM